MSLPKKLALLIVPAVALALPLSAATTATAAEHGHGHVAHEVHWDHHDWHFGHHERVFVGPRVVIGGYVPAPVVVTPSVVSVFYRVGPVAPWTVYGTYGTFADAQSVSLSLQTSGYQCFIR
ncbi:MAG TPA: hypothetical protein VGH32_10500 [Pirellulales bacterium]